MNWDQIEFKWAEMTRRVQAQWSPRKGAETTYIQRGIASPVPRVAPLDEKIDATVQAPSVASTAE